MQSSVLPGSWVMAFMSVSDHYCADDAINSPLKCLVPNPFIFSNPFITGRVDYIHTWWTQVFIHRNVITFLRSPLPLSQSQNFE